MYEKQYANNGTFIGRFVSVCAIGTRNVVVSGREMKVNEFRQTVDRVLSTTVQKFIDSKNLYAMTTLELNYGWHPNNLFFWKYGCRKDSISNVSMDIYSNLSSRIIYDCLFYNNCIDINDIKSKYYTKS